MSPGKPGLISNQYDILLIRFNFQGIKLHKVEDLFILSSPDSPLSYVQTFYDFKIFVVRFLMLVSIPSNGLPLP